MRKKSPWGSEDFLFFHPKLHTNLDLVATIINEDFRPQAVWYRNEDGNGNFGAADPLDGWETALAGDWPSAIVLADVDGDSD